MATTMVTKTTTMTTMTSGLFLACENFGRVLDNSFPACALSLSLSSLPFLCLFIVDNYDDDQGDSDGDGNHGAVRRLEKLLVMTIMMMRVVVMTTLMMTTFHNHDDVFPWSW